VQDSTPTSPSAPTGYLSFEVKHLQKIANHKYIKRQKKKKKKKKKRRTLIILYYFNFMLLSPSCNSYYTLHVDGCPHLPHCSSPGAFSSLN
jgi:hypothetical protein